MSQESYKQYLLIVLLAVMIFINLDRQVLGLALQDLKGEMSLTDTQLGFLTGLSFALFYSIAGLPLARWADRGNRVLIITLTTMLCAVAVVFCGLVQTYTQLLSVRAIVAIGETGLMPTANSLIADYFTRSERPRAQAFYLLGGPLAFLLSELAGGWMIQYHGWRLTFITMGLPGLVLGALVWLGIQEPRRRQATQDSLTQPSLGEVCVFLWRNRTFRALLYYYSLSSFFGYGTMQWLPAFFIRSYGVSLGSLGTWLAVIMGIPGLLGIYWGGRLASRYAPHSEALQLQGAAVVSVVSGVLTVLVYCSPTPHTAFVLIAAYTAIVALSQAPYFAVLQTVVPENLRAQSMALLFLISYLLGMGLGPLAAGALSDGLLAIAGRESLRYSLLILSPVGLWSAWYLWKASRSVSLDLASMELGARAAHGAAAGAPRTTLIAPLPEIRK